MMDRFTIDVIASCAFGINGNSLKDPDAEFGRYIREVTDFSVKKGLAMLMAFFAPHLQSIFQLKVMDDETNNYVRQIVWSTGKLFFLHMAFNETVHRPVGTEIFIPTSIDFN
jgi:hypothetical protein